MLKVTMTLSIVVEAVSDALDISSELTKALQNSKTEMEEFDLSIRTEEEEEE